MMNVIILKQITLIDKTSDGCVLLKLITYKPDIKKVI